MKQRILALFLAITLFFCAAPAAFAGYAPQNQLELLKEADAVIREEGLESSLADQPLKRAVAALLGGEQEDEDLDADRENHVLAGDGFGKIHGNTCAVAIHGGQLLDGIGKSGVGRPL